MNNVIIGFQDETRIGQQGSLTRIWGMKGTRPRVVRQKQFLSTNIFGVVCPEIDSNFVLILPEKNTEMMQLFLDEYSKIIPKNKFVALVVDQAGWHKSHDLKIPANMCFVLLPPYSPELNPIEQLWSKLKQGWLANRCFKNYNDIVESTAHAWRAFTSVSGAIKKLCSRSWATLSC